MHAHESRLRRKRGLRLDFEQCTQGAIVRLILRILEVISENWYLCSLGMRENHKHIASEVLSNSFDPYVEILLFCSYRR